MNKKNDNLEKENNIVSQKNLLMQKEIERIKDELAKKNQTKITPNWLQ